MGGLGSKKDPKDSSSGLPDSHLPLASAEVVKRLAVNGIRLTEVKSDLAELSINKKSSRYFNDDFLNHLINSIQMKLGMGYMQCSERLLFSSKTQMKTQAVKPSISISKTMMDI